MSVLAVLLLIACSISAISAYSNSGAGVIDHDPSGDNYTNSSDVASEVYYDNASSSDSNGSSSGGSSGSAVSLTQHPTAHPLLLLLACLTLAGVCSRNLKR